MVIARILYRLPSHVVMNRMSVLSVSFYKVIRQKSQGRYKHLLHVCLYLEHMYRMCVLRVSLCKVIRQKKSSKIHTSSSYVFILRAYAPVSSKL